MSHPQMARLPCHSPSNQSSRTGSSFLELTQAPKETTWAHSYSWAAFRWELILKGLAASNRCNKFSSELKSSLLQEAEAFWVAHDSDMAGCWGENKQDRAKGTSSLSQAQETGQTLDMIRNASKRSGHARAKMQPRTNLIITALRTRRKECVFQTRLHDKTKLVTRDAVGFFNFAEDFCL